MVKTDQKKDENISEYLIYMFQSEDLVRTFEFHLNRINSYVIANIPVSDTEKKELILWYASLIEKMRLEKIEKAGHLAELNELVDDLTELHDILKKTDKDYFKIVDMANPFIGQQIELSKNRLTNPVQVCLNAVYGFLLIKIDGREVTTDQQDMLNKFGDILAYLSIKYREQKI